ncbi:MAG: hypothetical protein II723_08235, partial [Oscillospiraceae bacterium]|nr:hypothetical protein [Oscillospiraceae bacterium]
RQEGDALRQRASPFLRLREADTSETGAASDDMAAPVVLYGSIVAKFGCVPIPPAAGFRSMDAGIL